MDKTIFAKLKPVAEKNLVAYRDDFFRHDKVAFRRTQRGETYVWVCRDHGTHLVRINALPEQGLDVESLVLGWDMLDALRDMEAVRAIRVIEVTAPHRGCVTEVDAIPPRPAALQGMHNKRPLFA